MWPDISHAGHGDQRDILLEDTLEKIKSEIHYRGNRIRQYRHSISTTYEYTIVLYKMLGRNCFQNAV